LECLRIGIDADEVHALDARADHVGDRIAAAAADADDLDDGPLIFRVCEYEHCLLLREKEVTGDQ
jgi:hypothetical protein